MSVIWLVTLLIYGCVAGFDFHPLNWFLLITLFLADLAHSKD